MPPRLQLLAPALAARPLALCARAAFSTSGRSLAGTSSLPQSPPLPTHAANPTPEDFGAPISTRRPPLSPTQRRTPAPGNETANSRILSLIDRTTSSRYRGSRPRTPQASNKKSAEDPALHKQALDLTKQISRRWRTGDVYAPHDLSSTEMRKWKLRGKPTVDVLDVLQLDPLVEYRVCSCVFCLYGFWLRPYISGLLCCPSPPFRRRGSSLRQGLDLGMAEGRKQD
jgi:hypothetical protein